MSFNSTPYKSRPPPGQLGSTPFRSSSASKFRSSLVPTSRPSPARTPHASHTPVKLTKTATGARDLFRTSSPRGQRTTEFAPDLPAEVTRPRASVRKFAPRKSVSTGMSNTASTEPFQMRIPSPDPDLTGQALAREVPDDPSRAGSIYADQFLAHKCPPHFDEIQRRQFFCILDLRRLKYAADEIFAKKDWKLNILNFAKEYEKSRGLIMLRYGLYEFKSVKPSSEVLKKWRAAHGLPPEPEEANGASHQKPRTPGPTGATKRKAAEELTPNGNTLMASTANQNKRRNVVLEDDDAILAGPTPLKKSKRKADETEGVDENKPNKQQKSTPSTATTLFESIINKPRDSISPSKPISQGSSLFGVSKPKDSQDTKFATKANPFQPTDSSLLFGTPKLNNSSLPSGSVLSAHKIGSTPTTNTGNIFSYLSESPSSSSGNENDNDNDDDRETDDEQEQDSEDQGPSAAVSTDTSTPPIQNGPSLFGTGKTNNTSNIFGGLSKPTDQSTKGGLFGRVQMGANGQPVRASPGPDETQGSPVNQPPAMNETPAKGPGDYTFDPATTPISFGKPALDVSKSSSTADVGPEPKKPTSIFGVSSQASSGSAPSAPSLFGSLGTTNPKSSEANGSIFAPQKPAVTSSIFGTPSITATNSLFGRDEQISEPASATKKQAVSIFGKPETSATITSETKAPTNNDADKTVSSTPATESKVPSIFDKSFIANNAAQAKPFLDSSKPSPDLFKRNSNPLFGGAKDSKIDSSIPVSKDQVKDQVKDQAPSIFDKSFIATNAAQTKKLPNSPQPSPDLFSRGSNPLFGTSAGAEKTNGTTSADTKSIFSQTEKPVSSTTTSNGITPSSTVSIFGQQGGSKPTTSTATSNGAASSSTVSIFGQQGSSKPATPIPTSNDTAPPSKGSIFGQQVGSKPFTSTTTSNDTATVSIFGQQGGSKPVASTSTLFGQKKIEEPTKPVASTSTLFGQKKIEEPTKSTSSIFGNTPSAPAPIFSFGTQPNPAPQSPSITFGAGTITGPSVSFGAPNSQAKGGDSKKVGFQFGNSGPSGGSASFTFGQDSSAGSSFTFTAGADKQSIANPFATSQPSSQPPAPVFGGSSSTMTPSSSFNFSFGQPASAPKAMPPSQGGGLFGGSATNGAPSFSFTQASPGQNSLDVKFPKSSAVNPFGHLQASEGSAVANSPFPAPSSIGTTPVNGTPEPQSPREDGEEAPQEQIKLTDGGPGEEDETILHEVRAKAIKYIPVQKGDEDEAKSPWSTRGVGPLRVLKNKSTGLVRILLRAEPRGHIAMNKTILSDVEYKAKEKTVNLVAASDDGSSLETWLLQVKKPEFAAELAGVLEANKAANKK